MRMMVDLPAPFGPRKPTISPRGDAEAHMIDGDEGAEALDEPFGDDRGLGRLDHAACPCCLEESDEDVLDAGLGARDLDEGNARGRRALAQLGHATFGVVDHDAARRRPRAARRSRRRAPSIALRTARACGEAIVISAPGMRCLSRCGVSQYLRRPWWSKAEARAALGLVQIGGRDQDRHAALAQGVENPPEIPPRDGIDAGRRLVEEEHPRRVDQRANEAELLLHPARELPGEPTAERTQVRRRRAAVRRARARRLRGISNRSA